MSLHQYLMSKHALIVRAKWAGAMAGLRPCRTVDSVCIVDSKPPSRRTHGTCTSRCTFRALLSILSAHHSFITPASTHATLTHAKLTPFPPLPCPAQRQAQRDELSGALTQALPPVTAFICEHCHVSHHAATSSSWYSCSPGWPFASNCVHVRPSCPEPSGRFSRRSYAIIVPTITGLSAKMMTHTYEPKLRATSGATRMVSSGGAARMRFGLGRERTLLRWSSC